MEKKHFVYILETEHNMLYCGYTDDVERRFQTHLNGTGAKFTKANKPLRIAYVKEFNTKSEALKEEYRIKHLPKFKKLQLINSYSDALQV